MGDSWLILVGILGIVLLGAMPTIIATITGRRVQVRTRTGSIIAEPYKTKKQIQKEDEQDKIVKELNEFCKIANLAKSLIKKNDNPFGIDTSRFDMWTTNWELELPDANGRPMLTNSASSIVEKGNVSRALIGYRDLKKKMELENITNEEFNQEILTLYNACT